MKIRHLEGFDTGELINELKARDADADVQAEFSIDLSELDADELRAELDRRSEFSGDLAEILGDHKLFTWLRDSNPPQEVRDAYWSAYGRIL